MVISVIVLFPKLEEAKGIRNLLVRNGIDVVAVCTTGAQVTVAADNLDEGLVICGYKFADMLYSELKEYLPKTFEMLLIASQSHFSNCDTSDVVCLSMPIKAQELVNAVNLLVEGLARKQRRRKAQPKLRTEEDRAIIESAKARLMEQRGMTEEEARKYIQKNSMDSGTNLIETAQMILEIF